MALTTTPGDASADSYASLAEADAYHLARGRESAWVDLDAEEKEPALRKATTYLDAKYSWKGDRVGSTQALGWPRYGVVFDGFTLASDAIPARLRDACCELALRALTEDLFSDVSAQHVESVKVGPIERKLSAPANGSQKRYPMVDAMLRDLTVSGNSIPLVRA